MSEEREKLVEAWRNLLLERIDMHHSELKENIVNLTNELREHVKLDEAYYAETRQIQAEFGLFKWVVKGAGTLASALGIERLYHFFKP